MGCDIHTVIEEKVGGKWIGVVASDRMGKRPIYAERNYAFFGAVAHVRGEGKNFPKGLPSDVSDLSWHLFSQSPVDHHSASHMSVDEFCLIHHQVMPSASREEYPVYDLMGLDPREGQEFRVVFWFDN
jgi:hypothetical protein